MMPAKLAMICAVFTLGEVAFAQSPQTAKPISEAAPEQQKPEPPAPRPAVPEVKPGELLTRYRGRLKVKASTTYPGWPPEKAIDGDAQTSWFSQSGDAAALRTKPWIEVAFPEDVTVQHVLALGNREPAWLTNYSIIVARIELYDAAGTLLGSQGNEVSTPQFDIEFHFKAKVAKVRKLRFVSIADQGDKNPFQDIAIGELRAW
jgi:hypothetical protein